MDSFHLNKAGRVIHMHVFKCLSSKLRLDFSTAVGIHTEYVIVPKNVGRFGGSGMFCGGSAGLLLQVCCAHWVATL